MMSFNSEKIYIDLSIPYISIITQETDKIDLNVSQIFLVLLYLKTIKFSFVQ